MKILSKTQMGLLMTEFADGGIVFAEYKPDALSSEIMVQKRSGSDCD